MKPPPTTRRGTGRNGTTWTSRLFFGSGRPPRPFSRGLSEAPLEAGFQGIRSGRTERARHPCAPFPFPGADGRLGTMVSDPETRFDAIQAAVAAAFPIQEVGFLDGRRAFTIGPGPDDTA